MVPEGFRRLLLLLLLLVTPTRGAAVAASIGGESFFRHLNGKKCEESVVECARFNDDLNTIHLYGTAAAAYCYYFITTCVTFKHHAFMLLLLLLLLLLLRATALLLYTCAKHINTHLYMYKHQSRLSSNKSRFHSSTHFPSA